MAYTNEKSLEETYARRFGCIAIDKGFVTPEQVIDALSVQMTHNGLSVARPHKLIGEILFEKGWMSLRQIETVLEEIFQGN